MCFEKTRCIIYLVSKGYTVIHTTSDMEKYEMVDSAYYTHKILVHLYKRKMGGKKTWNIVCTTRILTRIRDECFVCAILAQMKIFAKTFLYFLLYFSIQIWISFL